MKNKTYIKTILIIFVTVIIVGIICIVQMKKVGIVVDTAKTTTPPVSEDSIKGCYVASLSKDVYTLNLMTQDGSRVSGTLTYKNFEKDSSRGTFVGTYENGILLGDYSFDSEGMHSVRQVIFKKTALGFVQGFGPVTVAGNKESFTELSTIAYDSNSTFRNSSCFQAGA